MRLYQDRLARLINFRKENDVKDERSEAFTTDLHRLEQPLIDLYSAPRQPYTDDFKVIQNYSSLPGKEQNVQPIVATTPTRVPRETLTPSLDWDEALGFSPKNTPRENKDNRVKKSENKKSNKKTLTTQERALKQLEIPNYMLPKGATRRPLTGKGSSSRLYVRSWI